jgi:hypothetical protein
MNIIQMISASAQPGPLRDMTGQASPEVILSSVSEEKP